MTSLPPELTTLPESIFDQANFSPVEDLALAVLRERMPESIRVQSLYREHETFPLVLVRREPDWGYWSGDPRFIDSGTLAVHALCEGVESDSDCARLSDAVHTMLRDSINQFVPGLGHFKRIRMIVSPRRTPDFATSSGPVQYADLPTGVTRYESTYEFAIRRPTA